MHKPVLPRIYLSPSHMSGEELEFVKQAWASNWIARLGPQVDAFEAEMAEYVGVSHAVALASGTAAIHLALRLVDVQPDDDVLCAYFLAYRCPVMLACEPQSFAKETAAPCSATPR
jgi:pyridoxal phosphate-dependent aminotransferase EpsN